MPTSVFSRLPMTSTALESIKFQVSTNKNILETGIAAYSLGCDVLSIFYKFSNTISHNALASIGINADESPHGLIVNQQQNIEQYLNAINNDALAILKQLHRETWAELDFINLFTDPLPSQDWTVPYDDSNVIIDLPSIRVIDISTPEQNGLRNYTVIFAPRAGNHSNIAEKLALYLRSCGLTRMAVVEQKCAEDIPLIIDGKRHKEDFASQVNQYKQALEHIKHISGVPAHLIAICQPGPLLISTLILNPHLGKTFGSAGSPMHTEAENSFLTDFARLMGEHYMDRLLRLFGRTIGNNRPGVGREVYDGALQVLGFYYLGMDQHIRNFKHLREDLVQGDNGSADRQKAYYRWYNTAHHLPAGFIKDTYKKVFVKNELINGKLTIGEAIISIKDYPGSVPIWAIGGKSDTMAPPLQATGHMDLIGSVPDQNKLKILCDGGHMALFRSKKIFKAHYNQIAEFLLKHSDMA